MPKSKAFINSNLTIPIEFVERRIYLIRGQKVILDSDLAELYQVLTKNLNLAVRRNKERFPADFVFQLTKAEAENLRLQIATSSYGGRRYLPYAFTEQGVAMLSSVLKSKRAVQMNIQIMRVFVQLRHVMSIHKDLAKRIGKVELTQKEHTAVLIAVVKDIKNIKNPPRTNAIGFRTK